MQGETILCIAPRLWGSLWRESQQLMSRIARQNRVLYFEPGRNYDRPLLDELWRNLPNFWQLRPQGPQENITVIPTPSHLPYGRRHLPQALLRITTPLTAILNAQLVARQVRWAMARYGVSAPILWINNPLINLVGKFGEKLSCYYNYDEYPDFIHNQRIRDFFRHFDNRLTRQVDLVFASSQAQWRRRKAINPNSYFVPNGVDFELFNRAVQPGLPLPDELAALPRPIIGFAGWLGYHIDVELLLGVATAYPNCALALVGPDALPDSPSGATRRLRALPNVFLLGQKDRRELANYLQAFDVALMPWIVSSGHVRSAYPLKLHEYLAAGRSIVAVDLPELQPYRRVLRIAESHEGFIGQIREALDDNSRAAVERRVAVARENTWDHRVAEIYRVVGLHLAEDKEVISGGSNGNTSGQRGDRHLEPQRRSSDNRPVRL